MAAPRKTTTKPSPAPKREAAADVESTPAPDPDGEGEQPDPEQPAAASDPAPSGYMWVTRRKSVQLGGPNPQWEKPSMIDVKSFPELEAQGWRPADGPDADGPSAK